MNIDEEKRSQWQALKGMGFKAYWDYFWDYYKIHVLIVAAVLIFGGMLIHDITNNIPYALDAVFINANSMEDVTALEDAFAESEGIDQNKSRVYIDVSTTLSLSETDGYSMTSMEKIYAQVAANEIDVMLADEEIFKNYAQNGMYADLRDYFSNEELSALSDNIYYVKTEESTEEIPVGIILENNIKLTENGCYSMQTPYAGIVVSTERSQTAADFIRFLLK